MVLNLNNLKEIITSRKFNDLIPILKMLDSDNKIGSVLKGLETIDFKNNIGEIYLSLLTNLLELVTQLYPHTAKFHKWLQYANEIKIKYKITSLDSLKNTNPDVVLENLSKFASFIQSGDIISEIAADENVTDSEAVDDNNNNESNNTNNNESSNTNNNEEEFWQSLNEEEFKEYISDLPEEEQELLNLKRKNYHLEKQNQWQEIKAFMDCFWKDLQNSPHLLELIKNKNPELFTNEEFSKQIHWLSAEKVFLSDFSISTSTDGKQIIQDFNNVEVNEDDFPTNSTEAYELAYCYDQSHPDEDSVKDEICTTLNNLVVVCQVLSTPDEVFDNFIAFFSNKWEEFITSENPDFIEVFQSVKAKFVETFSLDQETAQKYLGQIIFHNKSYIHVLLSKFTGDIKEKFAAIISPLGIDTSRLDEMHQKINEQLNKVIELQELQSNKSNNNSSGN